MSLTFAACGKDGKDKFEIERPDLGLASVTAGWGIGFRVGDEIFTNYFSSSSFWKYSQIHNISEIFTICFSNSSSSQYQQLLSLSLGAVQRGGYPSPPPAPPQWAKSEGVAVLLGYSGFTKDPMHDFNRLFC